MRDIFIKTLQARQSILCHDTRETWKLRGAQDTQTNASSKRKGRHQQMATHCDCAPECRAAWLASADVRPWVSSSDMDGAPSRTGLDVSAAGPERFTCSPEIPH